MAQGLKRPAQPMSDAVLIALTREGLMESYESRPPYQRNDYLGWINRAKLPATKQKRLTQMLDELRRGTRYMGMAYHGGK